MQFCQIRQLNPNQYYGACLMGLRGAVIKSYGAVSQRAFIVAVEQAMQEAEWQIPERIAANLDAVLPKSD